LIVFPLVTGVPEYISDDSSQGVALTSTGLLAVTGETQTAAGLLTLLNYTTGDVVSAKNYGLKRTETRIGRVVTDPDGGLLLLGDQKYTTYMIKTDSQGDSHCPARESDPKVLPSFTDAGIVASTSTMPPMDQPLVLESRPSKLVLQAWADEKYVQGCGN
jgi:hypothetical protein